VADHVLKLHGTATFLRRVPLAFIKVISVRLLILGTRIYSKIY